MIYYFYETGLGVITLGFYEGIIASHFMSTGRRGSGSRPIYKFCALGVDVKDVEEMYCTSWSKGVCYTLQLLVTNN